MDKPGKQYTIYNLAEKDLLLIQHDLEETYQGKKIIYFVDPFDVIEFAFPSLLDASSDTNLEDDTASQQYLAYDALFLQHPTLPIITKEYQLELRSLLNDLKSELNRYNHLNTKQKFLSYFLHLAEKPKLLQRRISILLVYSIGYMNFNMFNRINHLVSNPRFILPDTGNEKEQELLDDILLDTPPTDRVAQVFNLFCRREHTRLDKLMPEAKDVYLENTYRDIEVIDRIFEINKRIQEVPLLKSKYIVHYLSSSPHKSPLIFQLFGELMGLSADGNTVISILRNINHFSVLDSILGRNSAPERAAKEVKDLLDISAFLSERADITKNLSHEYQPVVKSLEGNLAISRDSLEHTYTMYKLFTTYESKTRSALEELQKGSNEGLKNIVESLYSYLQVNRDEKEKVQVAIDNYSDENLLQNQMLHFFQTSGKSRVPKAIQINVYAGRDVIRSHIQLYPVLLFNKELSTKGSSLLNELLLHVASPASHKKVFIANKYAQVQDHEFFTLSNFERKVFYLLLQLILPVSGKDLATQYPHQMSEERYKKEVEIIKNLERIYKINEKRLTAYVPMLDSEGHLNRLELFYYPPLTVKLEIGYFLSWMYRRVEEYDKAYSLIAECIDALSTQPGDPRLYHSRALCMISQAYALVREDTAGSKIRFRSAIKDLEQAKRLFENANSNRLMQQILVGIDNTICDACVELYLLEGEDGEELITRLARPLLDNFKSKLTEMEEQYEQYPSYNHTEADLEYCEALILYKQRKIADASRKIENAVKRLSVVDDSKLLQGNSYLSFSNKRINQLAIRIYKYKPGT